VLKVAGVDDRCRGVRFERLVIDGDGHSLAVDLHPRLTVLTGMEQLERDALTSEFVGALGSARPGVHLELQADNGTRFALFRPEGAPGRVIDIDNRMDVTSQFAGPDGRIDLLARANLDTHSARRLMQMGARQLTEEVEGDRLVLQMAGVDQAELWNAAERLREATANLESEADDMGSSVEDAEAVSRIEERHAEFERAQEQSERVRRVNFLVAGLAALLAIPATGVMGVPGLVLPALIAFAAVVVSIVYWRRVESASAAEAEALAAAGAQSYLGFHLQRVNGLLGSDAKRRRLLEASERHRDAQARWAVLAGNVTVEWAMANRAEVMAAAATRQRVENVDAAMGGDVVGAVSHVLGQRLAQLRKVGPGQESFPFVLDEPFGGLDEAVVPPLLELLLAQSANQQIMLFTSSPSIAAWARLEAMTGALEVIEPTPVSL